MRQTFIASLIVGGLLTSVAPVSAQGFGVGGRFAWVTSDSELDVDSLRFVGGQVRFMTGRLGFEASWDRHTEEFELVNQKITETPLQLSVMLRSGGRFAPYLLGGPGWYRRQVQTLEGPELTVKETEFGWHGGIGLEILPSKHFGIHGDYRYTFLDFNDDDDEEDEGFIGGLLPGHRGSMWTVGATIYF
jgi:opacity protein-like surface antigen